jgi:mannosyltransferase PIG-V
MWVRGADLATLALCAAAAWIALTGGVRGSVGPATISVTSSLRLLLFAVVLAALRHALRPRPSLPAVLWAHRPRRMPAAWADTAVIWFGTRFSVILAGYFAVLLIGFPQPPPQFKVSDNIFVNLPARFDTGWYLDIAVNGYRWMGVPYKQQNIAFFPAFPMAMRASGAALGAWRPGISPIARNRLVLLGGWIFALAVFWYALVYLHRWSDARAGPDVARATVMLLAVYPFAVFFSAPYTEGLFMLAAIATFFHFERQEWLQAALWGLLSGLVRPNGALLAIPLALLALQQWRRAAPGRPSIGMGLALGAPAVGLFFYALFIEQLTGRWFAWSDVQAAWGRTYQVTTWVGLEVTRMSEHGILDYPENAPITLLNGLAALMALLLLWRVGTAIGAAYVAFVLVNLGPALISGGLMSVGRFTSTLFPLFYALAVVVPRRHLMGWVLAFGVLQGLFAALFFTWRPPF